MKKWIKRAIAMVRELMVTLGTRILFILFQWLPLQNKVVATGFKGQKFGDNPQYILEELHKISPETEIVWVKHRKYSYEIPDYVHPMTKNLFYRTYAYATAKVWINTHRYERSLKKRKDQLVIETWHGGLGIKKIDGDVPKFRASKKLMKEVKHTSEISDVFISNSDHLTNIYRTAFFYNGPVYKCGYPKNDILFKDNTEMRRAVRDHYALPQDARIIVYAPTFRDSFTMGKNPEVRFDVYDIDYDRLNKALANRFGGEWHILVKHHPFLLKAKEKCRLEGKNVINATNYPDMQELIMASDVFISDYSSCIFDAAIREIPCFTYAKDFEEYKGDRGAYYEMEELPFPYARNNDELMRNIEDFDYDTYIEKWNSFKVRTGLHETGHAAKDIAEKIKRFINGENVAWD